MKKMLYLVAVCAMICSCKGLTYSTRTANTSDVPTQMWAQWNTSELAVSEYRVTGVYENPNPKKLLLSEQQMKDNAIGAALERANADILIDPQFTMEYQKGRLVKVTVSGYAGKHTNFRTISFEEQSQYMIEKEKAANAPQILINGAEVNNHVDAPAPAPCPEAPAAEAAQGKPSKRK